MSTPSVRPVPPAFVSSASRALEQRTWMLPSSVWTLPSAAYQAFRRRKDLAVRELQRDRRVSTMIHEVGQDTRSR